uniref:Uncharacterized protein n=1 Tax=Hyaloperonospora arabidopsidis (strain Emoy2) TaxID=559515 RepID=M4BJ61_HYAAE
MLDIDKPPQKYDSIALPGPYLTPELALFRHYLTLSNDSIQYVFARYSEGSVGCFSKRASSHRFQGRPLLTIGHKEFLGRKTVSKECSSNHVYGGMASPLVMRIPTNRIEMYQYQQKSPKAQIYSVMKQIHVSMVR